MQPASVVVSANGCSYSGSYGGSCSNSSPTTNTRKVFAEMKDSEGSAFKFYPNPNEGSFVFETDGSVGEAFIINTLGQIVDKISLTENVYSYAVNLSAKGTYLLKIKTNTASKSITFVAQ